MSVVAITSCLIIIFNILMWFILLHRFNSFFSTKKIVDETRNAINEKIREANNAAERNMDLIDGKIQELNKVKAEADRRLAVLKRELDTQQREMEFRSVMSATSKPLKKTTIAYESNNVIPVQGELVFTQKAKNELGINENVLLGVDSDKSYTEEAKEQEKLQKIPIVNPVVYRTQDQIVPKKDFFQLVREYHISGIPDEEIARLTSRSAQEVRLVLQML